MFEYAKKKKPENHKELSLDNVRLNYNSARPEKWDVPVYPQGDRVEISSGQKHYGSETEKRTEFIQRMGYNAVIQKKKYKRKRRIYSKPSARVRALVRRKALLRSITGDKKSDSLKLRINMIRAGVEVPNYANAAHHIVAARAIRAQQAREILKQYHIGINDAVNGVFLPTSSQTQERTNHRTLHTNNYYSTVNFYLSMARNSGEVIRYLNYFRRLLMNGESIE